MCFMQGPEHIKTQQHEAPSPGLLGSQSFVPLQIKGATNAKHKGEHQQRWR